MTKNEGPTLEALLELLGQRGVYTILRALRDGPLRFGSLQQATALPPRSLSLRLKELEELGLIRRTEHPEVPPRVDYALTARGQGLQPALEALAAWEAQASGARSG
ncbi:MAG: helix-turn-helix transcriptional regulator [Meiothermus sp.]|uniref:winged helix-turn-helix transcriptional regulator n=1 Tax=Meiothermus sp. TaxID=1955249 RepID=UPI0025E8B076|nr:helix-turn-helix domain-containing protein [Meiothermus sp.]MCS7058699.1 helix-turn-helix transcriptional regulator [Meiothermus sp.]MCS7195291.1 helix-turn-helix transcriptional regulator [Meiothermus sp.]MCX7741151.1 helix-turn-helix transcriptional regulator [Meiothermus sp.]MDW8089974.1 helix-turn-helix domain-containing protein [Meiothermus sp.]MDW8480626.1 helix-turn-helix domain-containing protein [Meiothermus sp.]